MTERGGGGISKGNVIAISRTWEETTTACKSTSIKYCYHNIIHLSELFCFPP